MSISSCHAEVRFTVRCKICQKTESYFYKTASGLDIPSVGRPEGWNSINGHAICSDHQLLVLTNGEKEKIESILA